MPGDTVRRVYYRRPRWYSSEGETVCLGMRLGVVVGRDESGWVAVQYEDGGSSRGMDGCYRKVSDEEAAALRVIPFNVRAFEGEPE